MSDRFLFFLHRSLFDGYGGVEYYLHDVISMTADIFGPESVRVVAPEPPTLPEKPPYPMTFVPRPEGKWAKKIFGRLPLRMIAPTEKEIREFSPSVVIGSHTHVNPVAAWVARKHGLPFCSVVYGIDCWGGLFPHEEWALRRSDKIISISHWTKDILVERGFSGGDIPVVHPRLPAHLEQLPALTYRDRPFTLLTVARLSSAEQYKGQDHVLKALAMIRESNPSARFRYLILGDGDDRERLSNMARDLGVAQWVEFQPAFRERADLVKAYGEADLFVMPSRFGKWEGRWRGEGFGIVYVEAAAFSVPSLAYRCGGAMDIIVDRKTGILLEQNDIAGLAREIESLENNREWCRALGSAAYQHVHEKFAGAPFRKALAEALRPFLKRTMTSSQSRSHSTTSAAQATGGTL